MKIALRPAALLSPALRRCLGRALDTVLPRACLLCEALVAGHERGLCEGCRDALGGRATQRCTVCAIGLEDASERSGPAGDTSPVCPACRAAPPAFDASLTLADYAAPLDRVLIQAKFHQRWDLLRPLADAWAAEPSLCARLSQQRVDVVVPVPLSDERLLARGYNQAERLAGPLAHRLGLRCRRNLLLRVRDTAAQSALNRMDREANLRDAFRCTTRLDGLRVAVVDDVMTTGATLAATAATLKAAGAGRVINLVVARTADPRLPARAA